MFELLINVENPRDDDPAMQAGMALASRHHAYATGLNIVEVYPSTMAMPDVAQVLEEEEETARACDAWWVDSCRRNGIDGAWEVIRGMYAPVLARRSSMADITVSRLPNGRAVSRLKCNTPTKVMHGSELQSSKCRRARCHYGGQSAWRERSANCPLARTFR
jgi:hypothetical protein